MATVWVRIVILTVRITLSVCLSVCSIVWHILPTDCSRRVGGEWHASCLAGTREWDNNQSVGSGATSTSAARIARGGSLITRSHKWPRWLKK
jgi:hypothetical protein